MSQVVKCDGCKAISTGSDRPKHWLRVQVVNGHNKKIAVGDWCSPDCLAMFLASDKLDKQIKRGRA